MYIFCDNFLKKLLTKLIIHLSFKCSFFIFNFVIIAITSNPGTGLSPGATLTLFLYGFQLRDT